MSEQWQVSFVDDLEKVRTHLEPRRWAADLPVTGFLGERVGVQVAIGTPDGYQWWPAPDLRIRVNCPGAEIAAHQVELVPTQLPAFPGHDDNYYDDVPGLYPDLLRPISLDEPVRLPLLGWNSVWLDLTLASPQVGPLEVVVTNGDQTIFSGSLEVEVTPVAAPPAKLTHLAWLHADGLAHHYGVDPWTEVHWTAVGNHISSAAQMGVTAILTPVWTPPLDTAVGHNRLNVQLLSISKDSAGYHFDTTALDRYLGLLRAAGISQVELPHLYTQWGAEFTPQIWIDHGHGPEQTFGWDVKASDPSYQEFLAALIPFLRGHLEPQWGVDNIIWHISDEPSEHMLEIYRAGRMAVAELLAGATVLDALSSPEFQGVTDHPVVATDHVHAFLEQGLPAPMVYYCVSQNRAVANRFIAQHSVGARHLAGQLFVQQATAFLHWGFNFYLQQYGLGPIDPFRDTSAGGRFPSGDPFCVYPGPDGQVWPSLRHRVLAEGSNDLRVMHWAEQLVGREAVLAVVDPDGRYSGVHGYEAAWPDPEDWKRRRLALDRLVREVLAR